MHFQSNLILFIRTSYLHSFTTEFQAFVVCWRSGRDSNPRSLRQRDRPPFSNKESNQQNYHSAQSVRYFIAEFQAFVVVGKEKERTAIYKPQPAPPDVTGRLSFYKESNQLNYHSAQSVRYFIAEFQAQKKPESFDSGFRCCWRSGRDSNPRPPA